MATQEVLIVEDEPPIREMVAYSLDRAGFAVRQAKDASSARTELGERAPHLMLIDWMLPGISGLEFIRSMKADRQTRLIPVILLTARGAEEEKLLGFECGVDDYVTKPFSPRELVARIRAVLRARERRTAESERIEVDALTLDPGSQRAFVGENLLQLAPTEYRLLELFMKNPERAYTRSQILDAAWDGRDIYIDERTVDVTIRRLRSVLEGSRCDRLIQTIRGVGYRFSAREAE